MRTIFATMIGYALFYFVRKNFSLAMPGIEAEMGISKTQLGIFLTLNGLIYGLSRFCHGLIADRCNARVLMTLGLCSARRPTSRLVSLRSSPRPSREHLPARSSPR